MDSGAKGSLLRPFFARMVTRAQRRNKAEDLHVLNERLLEGKILITDYMIALSSLLGVPYARDMPRKLGKEVRREQLDLLHVDIAAFIT
jgi:hypothetical protein